MEETILLSNKLENNQYIHEPKVISLKKIEFPKPKHVEFEFEDLSPEEQYRLIDVKIKEANEIHHSLQRANEKSVEETNVLIQAEKNAWKTEKENLEKLAKEQGFEAGFETGKQQAIEEYQGLINQGNELIESAMQDYHRTIEKHKIGIITLAIKVAEKIMTVKIDEDPTNFTAIIAKALDELKDKPKVEIVVHPDDYQHVLEQKTELEQIVNESTNLIIKMDANLQAKNCILEHPFGKIDVGIDSQLRQIKHALAEKVMEQD